MGPGLGGGFGRYEGYFGLVLDNIIEMDVVLADGSMITVSESSHPDLYWGMRGAGHNFGIVTRFRNKIYDIPYPYWYIVNLIFTGEKLEAFFELLNTFGANGTQPNAVTTYTLYALDPATSATEVGTPTRSRLGNHSKANSTPRTQPVIIFNFQSGGPAATAAPILAPFYALQPVAATNETVPYTGTAHAAGAGVTDPVCQPGTGGYLFPVGLQTYNIETNRAVYDLFKEMVNEYPAMSPASVVQFENYPMEGVRAVEPDSTAYAHRGDSLLVYVLSLLLP